MRRVVYEALLSAPVKLGSLLATIGGAASSLWPDRVKKLLNASALPVQTIGFVLVAIVIVYLLLLWRLKPGENTRPTGLSQSTSGDSSHNIHAARDVHFHPPQTSASPPDKPAYRGWDNQNLEGLARMMGPQSGADLPPEIGAILRDKERHVEEAIRKAGEPKPDLPLIGILGRVYRALGGAPRDGGNVAMAKFWRRVDLQIGDKVVVEHLHVWGRLGNTPLRRISESEWQDGTFNHKIKTLRVPTAYADPYEYTDLHFSKREIERVWPNER